MPPQLLVKREEVYYDPPINFSRYFEPDTNLPLSGLVQQAFQGDAPRQGLPLSGFLAHRSLFINSTFIRVQLMRNVVNGTVSQNYSET
jgi:hypothetical protein